MGAHMVRRYFLCPEEEPDPSTIPSFDPMYGFPERKERVMLATWQQMVDAQIPLEQRDYCAHYLIQYMKCRRDKFPNIFGCKHEKHDWDYCEYQDYVMRMKEYERERRLLVRKKRIKQKEKAAAAETL
ncbi:NADH dehydrogenase [ubiquinone] 1 beta subcomplex subunit 7 [Pogona vitticeps]|uniref:NADH dehydrogenase [ubiquinone] 1 beta subcomplex subunit 7 n=1 Tax=Pogona vitticeps TaxID=103695 RepID=A0A6J0SGI2_9SAUR|nr:NADH dehydrogenase [ubiquinone] 1 beta subcomplex subunit 7 [Pogona vitticeps]XP_020634180.1 NADH dehydrogenase [ubiquinone] 1 beta subcomplex subunit 7 [Pogona vitticeps]